MLSHMQSAIALLGSVGIVAMEASYVPQLWRLYRVGHADEVSLLLPGLSLGGRLCAIAYAYSQGQTVFVLGFVVGVLLRGGLLLQVAYYRARSARLRRQGVVRAPRSSRVESAHSATVSGATAVAAIDRGSATPGSATPGNPTPGNPVIGGWL